MYSGTYTVIQKTRTVKVMIMPRKDTGKYSFVNLTADHICPCQFDTKEEAIEDMQKKQENGEIIGYYKD